MGSETILFVGAHYEVKGSEITKYYFAGASRIAMRKYTIPVSMSVEYFLGDHLGSTSITTDNAGTKISEMRYKPWGEIRYSWTSAPVTTPSYKLSAYTFTGQYSYMDDPSTSGVTEGFGLMFYNARWYDPSLGRFAQADTIVPGGVQGLDRYAYVNNSPLMYTDPSGHVPVDCFGTSYCGLSNSDLMYDGSRNEQGSNMDSDTDNDGIPNVPDPDFNPITVGRWEQADCIPGNLVECFYGHGYMPTGNYDVTLEEFLSLMKAISYDVQKQGTMTDYSFKAWYDTPFYDGGGKVQVNVCIETLGCYKGRELNYIAQGAASASVGEGGVTMFTLVTMWKVDQYVQLPSIKTMSATGFGYGYYSGFHNSPLTIIGNTTPFFNAVSTVCPTMRDCWNRITRER